jgi:hypothetical protein
VLTVEQLRSDPLRWLSGVWRDCRAVIGPWGWLIVVYVYLENDDRAVVIAFHDARTSKSAISRR